MDFSICVVDGIFGIPASNVEINLCLRLQDSAWHRYATGFTETTGHLSGPEFSGVPRGAYRVEIMVGSYYASMGMTPICHRAIIEVHLFDQVSRLHLEVTITPSLFQAAMKNVS